MAAEIQTSSGQWVPYVPGDANDNGRGNIRIDGTVYSYYGGQNAYAQQGGPAAPASTPATTPPPAAAPSGGPEIQDPSTGQWYPYVPGDANDNGRGNIRSGGTEYSYDAYRQQQAPAAPPAATPPPAVTPPTEPAGGGGGGYTPPPVNPPPNTPSSYTPPPPGTSSYTPPPAAYQPQPPSQTAPEIAATPPVFNAPKYTPPPAFSYADFTSPVGKPEAFSYADFQAPTAEDIYKDPSYNLRFQQGQSAIENSASARGVIGTGGTIKDFINYGQNFASQEYGNVYNRQQQDYQTNLAKAYNQYQTNYQTQYTDPYNEAMQTYGANRANAVANYNTNYQTQYTDPFQMAFSNAQAELQPQELAYTTKVGAAQHASDAATAAAQHDADQSALYGFNNKVFDANYSLQSQQSNFDEWYKKYLLQLQASQ